MRRERIRQSCLNLAPTHLDAAKGTADIVTDGNHLHVVGGEADLSRQRGLLVFDDFEIELRVPAHIMQMHLLGLPRLLFRTATAQDARDPCPRLRRQQTKASAIRPALRDIQVV